MAFQDCPSGMYFFLFNKQGYMQSLIIRLVCLSTMIARIYPGLLRRFVIYSEVFLPGLDDMPISGLDPYISDRTGEPTSASVIGLHLYAEHHGDPLQGSLDGT